MQREILDQREQRKTISKFGLDVIITPDNEVKIIEINGENSGSKGLEKLTGQKIDIEMMKYLEEYGYPMSYVGKMLDDTYLPHMEELDIGKLSKNRLVRVKAPHDMDQFVLPVYPSKSNKFKGIIWANTTNHFVFNESRYIVVNPYAIENACNNKQIMNVLFNGDFGLRPKTNEIVRQNKRVDISKFKSSSDYVILKPTEGVQGKDVMVIRTDEIFTKDGEIKTHPMEIFQKRENSFYHNPNVIMEELVPSKIIKSIKTGRGHFACMRYLVLVDGMGKDLKINHYGGYWRLSPNDVTSDDLQKRMIANYSKGAIPEVVSDNDLTLVQETIDSFLPKLYRRLLRLPINDRQDRIPLKSYCY